MGLGVGLTDEERQELTLRQDNPTLERLYAVESRPSQDQLEQELPLVLVGTPLPTEDDGTDKVPKKGGAKKKVQRKKASTSGETNTLFLYPS